MAQELIIAVQKGRILRELKPLFNKHMDDIMSGHFSKTMMEDWANDDKNLLTWRALTENTAFEKSTATEETINEQDYFDHGVTIKKLLIFLYI